MKNYHPRMLADMYNDYMYRQLNLRELCDKYRLTLNVASALTSNFIKERGKLKKQISQMKRRPAIDEDWEKSRIDRPSDAEIIEMFNTPTKSDPSFSERFKQQFIQDE